jgi:uncharacterized protein (TIGR02246 family)
MSMSLRRLSNLARYWPSLVISMALALATWAVAADKKEGDAPKKTDAVSPEGTIRATANAFVAAFNKGDAKAVANLWVPDGTLTDDSDQVLKGRKAIEDEYAGLFKEHPTARMQVGIKSIEFPTPTTAIEVGVARVMTRDNAPPSASRYTVIHVRLDGKWLMASVHETAIPVSSNFAQLEDLAWLVGTWETNSDGNTVRSRFRWIANKSFIQRDYSVNHDGVPTNSGTQILGWDPQAQQVRSLSFDSSGGYGTGLWSPGPEGMWIDSSGLLADGTPTSSKELLIRIPGEDNVLGWRSTNRRVGDVALPDDREVVLDRVPEKQ